MKRLICAAAALVIGATLATSAEAAFGGNDCLQPTHLYGWKVVDNQTILVTDRLRHTYKVSLHPGCADLKFSFGLGFKEFSTTNLSCMQRGDSVVVPAGGGLPRQSCFIDKVEAYTPEMAHADAANSAMNAPH